MMWDLFWRGHYQKLVSFDSCGGRRQTVFALGSLCRYSNLTHRFHPHLIVFYPSRNRSERLGLYSQSFGKQFDGSIMKSWYVSTSRNGLSEQLYWPDHSLLAWPFFTGLTIPYWLDHSIWSASCCRTNGNPVFDHVEAFDGDNGEFWQVPYACRQRFCCDSTLTHSIDLLFLLPSFRYRSEQMGFIFLIIWATFWWQ